jgi:hypothetical protein
MGGCKCTSGSSHSEWTGNRRVRSGSTNRGSLPSSGCHKLVSLQLNSVHFHSEKYKFALTVRALEIIDGEMTSGLTFSTYASSHTDIDERETELSIDTVTQILPFEFVKIWKCQEDITVYSESPSGRLSSTVEKGAQVLWLKATVNTFGESFTPKVRYSIPNCPHPYEFYTETKCVHDQCGPSWAHYACDHRCLVKVCCTNGDCGKWTDLNGGVCGWDCF